MNEYHVNVNDKCNINRTIFADSVDYTDKNLTFIRKGKVIAVFVFWWSWELIKENVDESK